MNSDLLFKWILMTNGQTATVDGNEAAASVAYHINEVNTIYPHAPA